uniref:Uncharacterized protein n=2 Tax=Wuchereria bancrofti TaxID=6293 RepID=A0A1I8EJG9_WUCBA
MEVFREQFRVPNLQGFKLIVMVSDDSYNTTMGVTTTDSDEQATSEMAAAKPKERQFQVVPVPGTFTRGRWKCWDYKDKTLETGAIIDFTEKSEKHSLPVNIVENPVGCRNFISHGQTDTMNNTANEPHLISGTDMNGTAISQAIDVSNMGKESSTIVVTSIDPPSVTPIHGTPSSASTSPAINNATVIETKEKVSDHKNLLSLQTAASAPVLNAAGVALAHTPQFYRTSSATTSYLEPLSELPDPNVVVQQPFASESITTNVPLTVIEADDPSSRDITYNERKCKFAAITFIVSIIKTIKLMKFEMWDKVRIETNSGMYGLFYQSQIYMFALNR